MDEGVNELVTGDVLPAPFFACEVFDRDAHDTVEDAAGPVPQSGQRIEVVVVVQDHLNARAPVFDDRIRLEPIPQFAIRALEEGDDLA